MKKYDKYQIGHARMGWYIACSDKNLDWPKRGKAEYNWACYLHPDGKVRSYAGDRGYFETESLAEYALDKYKGEFLPEGLFEI